MPDSTLSPTQSHFVLVAGAMNPAIHSALWYRTIGAIDETEYQATLEVPTNVTASSGSQLQFGETQLAISCQPEQWWIHAKDAAQWNRAINIASIVFEKLSDTPITGFGLLSQRHVETGSSEVKTILASCIAGANLGFPAGKSTSSSLQLVTVEEDFEVTTLLQPSRLAENMLFTYYHSSYAVSEGPVTKPAIGTLLKTRIAHFEQVSDRFCEEAVAGINARLQG